MRAIKHSINIIVVLAGGKGTRLWPVSTEENPKQLLKLPDGRVMIESVIDRLSQIVPRDNIFVVTNRKLYRKMASELEGISILTEDESIGTLHSIIYSLNKLKKKYDNANIMFIPSDQFVFDDDKFKNAITKAFTVASATGEIVLIGSEPEELDTRFGYIACKSKASFNKMANVNKFIEKPDYDLIKAISENNYLYKSMGIIICNIEVLLNKIVRILSDADSTKESLKDNLKDNLKENFNDNLKNKFYDSINEVSKTTMSVDKAILEKSIGMKAVITDARWIDVGTFESFAEMTESDRNSNTCINGKDIDLIDVKNSIIYDDRKNIDKKKIIVSDVRDLVIAVSDDGLIIRRKRNL